MSTYLCLSVRFLQPMCHGRGDGGEPEWPPSPLRAFPGARRRVHRALERARTTSARLPALRWLECQPAPSLVAAVGQRSRTTYRLYVPDNVGDKVAGSWSRGGAASIADYRTEKDVCPTHLVCGGDAVHYLWALDDKDVEIGKHGEVLFAAAAASRTSAGALTWLRPMGR